MTKAPFRPGWPLTLQAGLALAIVLGLAAWQFARGFEKTALADAREERLRAAPVDALAWSPTVPDFTRLRLAGYYDAERHFLIAGPRGAAVQVVTPLRTEGGVFLVHRGWLASADTAFDTPSGRVTVTGVVWPSSKPSALATGQPWPEQWPKVLRRWDLARMASDVEAVEREVRLPANSEGVLRPATLAWNYSPGTHWGYAAQWVLIGAAVVVGYVVIGRRRHRQQTGDAS